MVNQKESNLGKINIQKSCQRGSFKYQIALDHPALKDSEGHPLPKGTPVKLSYPRTTFAHGLTIDGRRFLVRSEWLEPYQPCGVCVPVCGSEAAHGR